MKSIDANIEYGQDLTVREVQILRLVANGLVNAEIGRRLHLTENTIKVYMQRITWKLGTRGRAHAVGVAFQLGLLTLQDIQPRGPVAASATAA